MKLNIIKAIVDLKNKQILTDNNGNYWLRKDEIGLHSQPVSKEIVKAHYEQMRSLQVPMFDKKQYVLKTATAKYLINADGDMFLLEEKIGLKSWRLSSQTVV
jgi:PhoPQ-activated pathogenicity-related protein